MKKTLVVMGLVVAVMAMMVAPAFAPGEEMVRVTHASPDAPAVDVCVNGSVAFAALEFGKTTDYANLPAGSYDVQVYPAGSNCQGTAVIDAKGLNLDAKAYTVVAIGKLAEIKPLILVDNLSAPAAGKVHVRFVHASPDAPAVDITTKDGAKVFSNVAFGKSTDTTPLPAGTYDLQARVAGTDTVALDLPGVNLPEGAILTVVAQGFAGGAEPKLGVQVISSLAFSPDGHWLATGSGDHTARLWDINNLSAQPIVLDDHESSITTLAFSADVHWLATGSMDNTARLWDMNNFSAKSIVLHGHQDDVVTIAFSPDGHWLATGGNSDDSTIRLWDYEQNICETYRL